MLYRYVKNWYDVLFVYLGVKKSSYAIFDNGKKVLLSRNDFADFYEAIYRRHLLDNGFKIRTASDGDEILETPDHLFYILPKMVYALIFDEIYLTQVYGKPALKGRVVIDVGSAIGDSTIFFCNLGAVVYGYEIEKVRYDLATKNVKINKMENKVTLFNEEATAEKINALMKRENLDNVMIKMDCEGCEYRIIPAIDLGNVRDLIVEYHKDHRPLIEALEQNHFAIDVDKKNHILKATKSRMLK